jgi:hypothetical protein
MRQLLFSREMVVIITAWDNNHVVYLILDVAQIYFSYR